MLKKNGWLLLLSSLFILASAVLVRPVFAQNSLLQAELEIIDDEATTAAQATSEGSLATPSAEVVEKIQKKTEEDITQPTVKQKSKLAQYLDDTPVSPLSWNNFIQHSIRKAIADGVAPNIIVLVLLFPLVASLIAASRHIIGLRGFGIYIPAVLAVALVSTGIMEGLAIFGAIVVVAIFSKKFLRKTKLSYLPRTAMLLWLISMGIFAVMLLSPTFGLVSLMSINIFPILILVLLSENFLDAQSRSKQSEAIALTVETLALAFASSLLLRWDIMQKFALTEPELLIFTTALINVIIGKFTGLRVKEWFRFRSLIEE